MLENTRLIGQSILIVEDEPLISFHLQSSLQECGASVISAPHQYVALSTAQHAEISAAIIDSTMGASDDLCDALHDRGIPFMFYTGDDKFIHAWAPVLFKPSAMEDIVTALAGIIRHGSNRKQVNVPVKSTLRLPFKD